MLKLSWALITTAEKIMVIQNNYIAILNSQLWIGWHDVTITREHFE